MRIQKIPLRKHQIDSIPNPEKRLLFGMGHVANELAILQKLILVSSNENDQDEIQRDARLAQYLFFLELFAQKAVEAWKFLLKHTGEVWFSDYMNDPDGRIASPFQSLDDYFKNPNLLKKVRNKLSAHYDVDAINRGIASMNWAAEHQIYMSEHSGNSLYYAAEEVFLEVLSRLGKSGATTQETLNSLADDAIKVASLTIDCVQGIMIVVTKKYFGGKSIADASQSEDIETVELDSLSIPFFIHFRSDPTQ